MNQRTISLFVWFAVHIDMVERENLEFELAWGHGERRKRLLERIEDRRVWCWFV